MRTTASVRRWWRPLFGLFLAVVAAGLACAAPDFDRLMKLAVERYGQGGGAAVAAWRQLMAEAAGRPEAERVARINAFFNARIQYEDDQVAWNQADYWATPLESLGRGAGDCEDYAIAKYTSLAALGVPREKLRLIYVRAQIGKPNQGHAQAHMVLGYYPSPAAEPLVLDSLTNDIRPASRRPDLTPIFSFNGEGLWAGGTSVSDPTARLSRWRDVLARMAKEGMQ